MSAKRLVLEIEVPDFNVEGAQEAIENDDWGITLYDIVTEEWMRPNVVVVANDIPGEKCQNHEFEIHSLAGRIVGARLADGDTS